MKKPRKTTVGQDTSIVDGILYFEDARQCAIDDEAMQHIIGDGYTKAIRVVSLDAQYIQTIWHPGYALVKEKINVEMTLRREIRSGRGHWYAYRRVGGTLWKRYVGTDDRITTQRILDVAVMLPTF